jgi:DNA-binding beta-propeller fold protein YncE
MATVIPTVMDKIRERAVVLTSKNELSRVIGLIIFLIPAIGFTHNFSHDQPEGVLNLPVIDTDPSKGLVLLETNPIDGAKMPRFAADATWPSLPTGYLIGQVSGVAVDQEGDIWVVNRPNSLHSMDIGATRSPPISICCKPLKEVIEFDRDGKIKQNWSGRETAPLIDGEIQYPSNIHGIYVDTQNTVWIAGNGPGDHLVVRYTSGGEHIAQFGKRNKTNGNLDKELLGNPADVYFDALTSHVLIADGYTNRRIIEFDYQTRAFEKYWGAFGELPQDASRTKTFDFTQAMTTPEDGVDPKTTTFSDIVHCIVRGPDHYLYACDRRNNRIQVFLETKDGTIAFKESIEIAPVTGGTGSATDIAWSPDGEFMYVADMINGRIWVFDSQTRKKLGSIGRPGRYAGQFHWLHSLDADQDGNLYATEVHTGQRVQKLVFLGVE